MTSKRCVFIESNTTGTGEILLRKALNAGYEVLFLTATPTKYRFLNGLRIHLVSIDTRDVQRIYKLLAELGDIACVMSTSEYFIHTCAQLCALLALPSNSADAIACCRDKFALANRLRAAEVATPKTWVLSSQNIKQQSLLSETATGFSFPCVVKPISSSGSIGVQRIEARHQLDSYLQQTQESNLLCQEYIEGEEYSVESFSLNGKHTIIGITRKYLGDWPFFVETGHDFPASVDKQIRARLEAITQNALDAVGFEFGPSHIELRVCQGKPWIIEINPRLAGGMIPELIKQACGSDPLALLFDLYRGEFDQWLNNERQLNFSAPKLYSAIRFLVADRTGQLADIQVSTCTTKAIGAANDNSDHQGITLIKQAGEQIKNLGDFSSRLAHAIASATSEQQARDLAEQRIAKVKFSIKNISGLQPNSLAERIRARLDHTGRLASGLDTRAQAIMSEENPLSQNEIATIADIDEAHILMLNQQGLLDSDSAKQLLACIATLQQAQFADLRALPHPRGIYLSYEAYLSEKLGDAIGGQLQLGRSRNDLNATVNALQLRTMSQEFCAQCWRLTSVLLHQAIQHKQTLLPIYSQYQTALPGTYAHYLAAIATDLIASLQQQVHLHHSQFQSPLGAGAGGGTALNIDSEFTAKNLGFVTQNHNALSAVSSRTSNLRLCSEVQNCVLLLSRVAQDLQFMSSREVGLITLPDRLCGGSSSMPQKKNPYLLEWIKAQVSQISGDVNSLFTTLSKTPFSNSYEVSSMCARQSAAIINRGYRVISMMTLLIEGVEVNHPRGKALIEQEYTWATYLTEQIAIQEGQNFRRAHHQVGEMISAQLADHNKPFSVESFSALSQNNLALNAEAIVNKIQFGGGPAPSAVTQQLNALFTALREINLSMSQQETQQQQHQHARKQAIQKLLKNSSSN